ncbi:hypothetical protein [Paenibacillus sp. YPG26]|uniref:hypothetical protein n=1 Tax=Paenibacillus sp. YPG26 TaxID=2878915 RepID=UPI00203DE526|nr:hypothetical protein [Paenibacillus sp. YPG26]USB32411.1 hypothetical protein LDO05_13930 [Paenibacillus sp. YPG26]
MRRMKIIYLIVFLLLTACSSREQEGIISNSVTTKVITSKDQQYIEHLGYSVSLENKGRKEMHITQVEPVLTNKMSRKVRRPQDNTVNLTIGSHESLLVEGEITLDPTEVTQREAVEEEIFRGLNLRLQSGEVLYIPL